MNRYLHDVDDNAIMDKIILYYITEEANSHEIHFMKTTENCHKIRYYYLLIIK